MINVYLDANIVFRFGKPPYGSEFDRLIDLINSEQIRILTTDYTMAEVVKRHRRRDFDAVKCFCSPKLCRMLEDTIEAEFPTISEEQLWEALTDKYQCLVKNMINLMHSTILKIEDVKSSRVLSDYIEEVGFFADGKGKKHQFPDAFVFKRLIDEVSGYEPTIIVSDDSDYERPVSEQKQISLVKSIPSLFSELGLVLEDPNIEKFLVQNHHELIEIVNDELSNWELEGNIEDSEITKVEVIDVKVDNSIAFKSAREGGPILVVAKLLVMTNVDFTYLEVSTHMYNPEYHDNYFDTLDCQNEIELKIDVSLSVAVDDKGNPIEIEALDFRNGYFVDVELEPYEDHWYEF